MRGKTAGILQAMCILLAGLVATVAGAQDIYDSRTLFRKGAWLVELTHNTQEGTLWCSAETSNRTGQVFSLTTYADGQFTIFIFDQSWDIADRSLRFLVDIDYSRWTMDGYGSDVSVSITPSDTDAAIKFVTELMAGNSVAVMNEAGRRLAVFSLSGSYASITRLMECWESIRQPGGGGSDPFGDGGDPF